jgi:hypothetical protein
MRAKQSTGNGLRMDGGMLETKWRLAAESQAVGSPANQTGVTDDK